MSDQPDQKQPAQDHSPAGRDKIIIHGNVGPGANIGSGSVTGDYFVGGDLVIQGNVSEDNRRFADLLTELRDLIAEAHQAGELDDQTARELVEELETATTMAKEDPKPPKNKLMQRLQHVADVIDAVVDTVSSQENKTLNILLKALPIAALLVKLASRVF